MSLPRSDPSMTFVREFKNVLCDNCFLLHGKESVSDQIVWYQIVGLFSSLDARFSMQWSLK